MLENFISKYLTAAHLALLAVAPLILSHFFSESQVATAMLWMSLLGIIWIMQEPSVREREFAHVARHRTQSEIFQSPLTWVLVAVIILALVRFLNDGIYLRYVPESGNWEIAKPEFEYLPASAGGCGYLPFSVAVSISVVILGVRHALDRHARVCFILMAAVLSTIDAIVLFIAHVEVEGDYHIGPAFAIFHLGCLVAMVAGIDKSARKSLAIAVLAAGGTLAGTIMYSSALETLFFAVASFVVVIYEIVYLRIEIRYASELKFLGFYLLSLIIGFSCVQAIFPDGELFSRLALLGDFQTMFAQGDEVRQTLTQIAMRGWLSSLWTGCGLGAFGYQVRFEATSELWQLLPTGASSVSNGLLQLVTERGIVGAMMLVVPAGFLVFAWVCGLIEHVRQHKLPFPAVSLMPVLLLYVIGISFFGCSLLRADMLMVAGAVAAISVAALRLKGKNDGR